MNVLFMGALALAIVCGCGKSSTKEDQSPSGPGGEPPKVDCKVTVAAAGKYKAIHIEADGISCDGEGDLSGGRYVVAAAKACASGGTAQYSVDLETGGSLHAMGTFLGGGANYRLEGKLTR